MSEDKSFFTYILRCADDTLYTGWTTDIQKRVNAHNEGIGARYTRSRAPVELMASWQFESKVAAMRSEYAIKKLSRAEKIRLIEQKAEPPLLERK